MTPNELVGTLHSERGLTLSEIGSLVGVTRVAVWNWKKGRSKPRAASLEKLQRLLDEGAAKSSLALDSASFSEVVADAKINLAEALNIDANDITVSINL